MLDNYEVERAKSGRSTCKDCFNKILFNEIRLKETRSGFYGRPESAFYCKKCAITLINEEIHEEKRMYDRLKKRLIGGIEDV